MKAKKVLGAVALVTIIGGLRATGLNIVTKANDNNESKIESSANESTIVGVISNRGDVSVKAKDSMDSDELGTLKDGDKVNVIEVTENAWYKIEFNNGYGYVNTAFVDISNEEAEKVSVKIDAEVQKAEEVKVEAKTDKTITNERTNLNKFLFIGDSYTYLLKDTILAKNNNDVYVHAKSGSYPKDWVNKVESMPDNKDVEGVVLLIGVNGASTDSNKANVKILIDKLSAKYKDKTIYVQKIFPVGTTFTSKNPAVFNSEIATLNNIIDEHVKTVDNAVVIDTRDNLVTEDGYLKYTYDGLHISPSQNDVFYGNILEKVSEAEQNLK